MYFLSICDLPQARIPTLEKKKKKKIEQRMYNFCNHSNKMGQDCVEIEPNYKLRGKK